MQRALLILVLALLPLYGCSVTLVTPKPSPTTTLSSDGKALTATHDGVKVTVGVQDLEVDSYKMVDNLTSFSITIENDSNREISIPLNSLILITADGNQYRPVSPDEVKGMVQRDSPYLVPYPYVGYYYEGDNAKAGSLNAMTSSLPFYAENHPQDIFTQALPGEAIIPGAKINGLVYFVVDLSATSSAELRIYPADSPMTGEPLYAFAFSVEKQ